MGTTAGVVISTIIGAAGTTAGIIQSNRASKAVRRSEEIRSRQADLENQRKIRLAVGQARQQRASAIANASGAGLDLQDGSGLQGAIGSAQSQIGANVGFFQQTLGANQASNAQIARSNRLLNSGQTFQAAGQVPQQLGFGGPKEFGALLQKKFGED